MYNLPRCRISIAPHFQRFTQCRRPVPGHHSIRGITAQGKRSRNTQVLHDTDEDINDLDPFLQLDIVWFDRYRKSISETTELMRKNVILNIALIDQYTKNMEANGEFTVRGAIERIVYQAKVEKRISHADSIQEGLNALAKQSEFTRILRNEVKVRRLVLHNVRSTIQHLFQEVLRHPQRPCSTRTIVIRKAEYNANEYVALVAFLKMQNGWYPSLSWEEERL
ncbi:hypothetical protein HOY80DRAFT_1049931 [Tuber brumale]|nr:hypothetical protein HOY80DRAFT_1049931 [Tuber brumale]